MKFSSKVLTLILLSLCCIGCGKPPSESDPPMEEIKYPDPVPDYPIEIKQPAPETRVNPTEVPLPPVDEPIPASEPTYVLTSHRCFEGNPNSKLDHLFTIKKERHGFFVFKKNSFWMYDCRGMNTCRKTFQLAKVMHGAFDLSQTCYENVKDQTEFSMCIESGTKPISTYRGNMFQMSGSISDTPVTFYCETSLPL